MQTAMPILQRLLLDLLFLAANAAAGAPLLLGIGLCAGRRGNALCYLTAGARLFRLALIFSVCGAFYFPASYLAQVLRYGNDLATTWAPFLEAAGLPWSSSLGAWLLGCALFWGASHFLPIPNADSYPLAHIKATLLLCAASTASYFSAWCLSTWPFAGLPQGMAWDTAAMAIFRNACSRYFIAFGVSAAAALAFSGAMQDGCGKLIRRWLAACAALGLLPRFLRAVSIFAGMAASGRTFGGWQLYLPALFGALCLFCALAFWTIGALGHGRGKLFPAAGFACLVVEACAPAAFALFK